MRAINFLAICALAATAFAQQQTPASQSTAPNPAVAPNAQQTTPAKPDAPPADPTATTSPTQAPPAQTKEDKSVTPDKQAQQGQQQSQQAAQPSTQQSTSPQPAQQNDQQSKLPQSDASPVAPLDTGGMTSADLQARIDAALRSEPTLTGDTLTVNVTDDEINVSGTVGSGKERTTASRIVQSFGENRKVKEKINVSGVKK